MATRHTPGGRHFLTLNDFSGGDEGLARPGGGSGTNTFRALNVWRYDNGIGPRQPAIAFPVTGLSTKAVQLFDLVPGEQLIFIYSDKSAQRADTGAAIAITALTNLPVDSVSDGGVQYYVSPDGFGSTYNVLAATMAVNTIPAARRIDMVNARAVIFPVTGVSPDHQSIAFSAYQDTATWPAANTFQVANSAGLVDMWKQGNSILLVDSQGFIYNIAGFLGVNETLRTVEQGSPPRFIETPFYPQGGVAQIGTAWWRTGSRIIQFDGARIRTRPGFERPSLTPVMENNIASHFLSLSEEGDFVWIMPGADSGASTTINITSHHRDDSFTQHSIPVNSYTPDREPRVLGAYSHTLKRVWLTTGGSTTQAPKLYSWNPDASFPATTLDGDSGTPTTATFRSGDWFAPIGTSVRVHSVTVDYSYKPADVGSNKVQFDINIEMLSTADDITTYPSAVQSFTPSASVTDSPDFSTIQRGRQTFGMGEQGEGAGFRVKLANWRGIIIHQITVAYTTEEYVR